jgi:hypothetical protein
VAEGWDGKGEDERDWMARDMAKKMARDMVRDMAG